MHHENILAGAFAYEAVDIERDAFGKAVYDGLHFDELRIHVVRARFGHGGQGVGSDAGPGRDANIAAIVFAAKIFSPRIIDDVDLGGRVEGIDARFAIAAQDDGADIAGPAAVAADGFAHGFDEFVAGVIDIDAVHFGGIEQALNVLIGAEDGGFALRRVAADAFEHGRSIVDHVGHDVNGGFVPGNEFAVVPDKLRLLNRHCALLQQRCFQKPCNEAEIVPPALQGTRRENPTRVTEHYS